MTMYQTGTGDPVRMFVERQHRLVAPKYNLLSVSEQPVEDPHWVGGIEYWPPVKRVDNVYGDRNLVCACPPPEAFED